VAPPTDREWDELATDLATRIVAFSPDWTHPRDGDPGITIVEVIAFLTESLLARSAPSQAARTRLRDVITELANADAPCRELSQLARVRYFVGRMLSADDLEVEQRYVRNKQRRHNRLLHGVGIVSGLDVVVDAGPQGAPIVVVSPGLAIGPDGEELLVCERMTGEVTFGQSPCYVTLGLVDRLVDVVPTPNGEEASRVQEVVQLDFLADIGPSHLALARLERVDGAWQLDDTFAAARLHR
jgi:hypothetical protein